MLDDVAGPGRRPHGPTLGIERRTSSATRWAASSPAAIAADHPERVDRLVLVDAGFIAARPIVAAPRSPVPIATLPLELAVDGAGRSSATSGVPGPVRMAGATIEVLGNDWQAKLPSIQAPTLVVWGEHDGICAPTIGRQIAAA